MKRLLGLSILVLSLPAAASVGRPEARPPPPRGPMAAVESSPQPAEPKAVQFERLSQVLDGVTVMELDAIETGRHVRRVVLRPDFHGGPGAALTVRF